MADRASDSQLAERPSSLSPLPPHALPGTRLGRVERRWRVRAQVSECAHRSGGDSRSRQPVRPNTSTPASTKSTTSTTTTRPHHSTGASSRLRQRVAGLARASIAAALSGGLATRPQVAC
jgi:hypothetical protein